jgi:hypothetical protein
MSKDIWHITNQNRKPIDIPEKENFIILDGVLGNSGLWYGGEEPIIFWENVKRWCYLDELILENERTRKALDVAVDALNRIDKQLMTGIEMTSQARNALEQITALEQKEQQ